MLGEKSIGNWWGTKRKDNTNKSFESKKQFFSEKSFERNQENGGKNWLSWHQTET